jgi:hypothetical protein
VNLVSGLVNLKGNLGFEPSAPYGQPYKLAFVGIYGTRNVVGIRIIVLEAVDRFYCIDPDDDSV